MNNPDVPPLVWLVIPCYRENLRLPTFLPLLSERLQSAKLPVAIQVVDDGSPHREQEELARYVESQRQRYPALQPIVGYGDNRGKGHAIRAGWSKSVDSVKWLGFVDADGAVPANEVERVVTALLGKPTPRIVAAVREHQEGAIVKRHPVRHFGSMVFQSWVRFLHHLPMRDTQCGLKFIPVSLYRDHSETWKQSRYAFDLELLITGHRSGMPIETIPVCWQEQAVSRLHLPAAIRLFWHAWRCGR